MTLSDFPKITFIPICVLCLTQKDLLKGREIFNMCDYSVESNMCCFDMCCQAVTTSLFFQVCGVKLQ